MIIYTFVRRITIITLPPIFLTILYTYPFRYIIYLGELSGNIFQITMAHLYTYTCIDIIVYIKNINETVVFSPIHMAVFVLIF